MISSKEYFTKYRFHKKDYWSRKLQSLNNKEIFDNSLLSLKDKNLTQSKKLFKKNIDIINLETSSYCNRKCSYCPVSIYGREKQIYISSRLLNTILNGLEEIKYDKAIILNLYNEPLATIKFFDYLNIIRKKLPNAIIGTNSNGDYIKSVKDLIKLDNYGLNRIKITAHVPSGKDFSKKYMVFRINEFAKRIGYKLKRKDIENLNFSFKVKNLVGIFQCPDWMKKGNSRGGTITILNRLSPRISPCAKPFREFTIYYDGAVVPCCDVYHGENYSKHIVKKISEVDKNDIFRIYAGEKLSEWRKSLFGWSKKKGICGKCSSPDLAKIEDRALRKKILMEV